MPKCRQAFSRRTRQEREEAWPLWTLKFKPPGNKRRELPLRVTRDPEGASGSWPEGDLDHRDCCRDHNWIANLRPANGHQNAGNSRIYKTNTSGYKGVSWHKRDKKWQAGIYRDGKMRGLGYFDDPEEAHEAYMVAAREYFGEFARAA